MSSKYRSEVEAFIYRLAKEISGEAEVCPESYVYRDLRIEGGDAVEFYQSIEERFSIDLRAITETQHETPRRWLLGTRRKVEPRDLPLKEIVTFIVEA